MIQKLITLEDALRDIEMTFSAEVDARVVRVKRQLDRVSLNTKVKIVEAATSSVKFRLRDIIRQAILN
jgi:hypothetical protein